jgi:hypothetical protein
MYKSRFILCGFSASEVSRIPWTTDFKAHLAMDPTQTKKLKRRNKEFTVAGQDDPKHDG